ncbi:TPA: phage tail protein [Streptococcus equi subsp. zooepidemicus]|uniref:phage tail protein n=1 Tax=Streptococcus equi TaxID=1336 RepID=UPI0010CAB64D|nr:phage tail protein [Streptococcus equi]MCD3368951.1 phage tail protein [Streptococcus equi subsp. zooepidemicus]VTS23286.1 phage protein [Streptococcus equi subsp. zooepidemicus]HEK9073978.1 phage tail protein [Streptococcus equi subsp. zooepidemicus]HEK9989196.1 phage tail protein [Streptococcus equi subsp. zooepidemicus]HEL0000127.1 phage tail protein [Streptococcus equi subsp. zooepidemicus]
MLITIHNANLEKVAYIDNGKQDTLNYYDDKFSQYLNTANSTFEFTVYKRGIKSDTVKEKAYLTLTERSFVSFKYNGKSYLFNVMTTDETDTEIRCYCENLNLELLNEYAGPYKATTQMSFVDYCNLFSVLKNGAITIGTNEVADKKRTIEWTGQDTNLKRLLSIANNFDAEIEFVTNLRNDSSLKSFILNIYKKNDANNQGVGRRRDDIILQYGKNIESVRRKIDKTGIYNAIRPSGKTTTTTTTTTAKQGSVQTGAVLWSGGNLTYAGHVMQASVVNTILSLCSKYKLLPSGVFSQLYLESFWGDTPVGRADNNWGGITWTGATTRPSGINVSQGQPRAEGGYYNHYASVDDYLKDYTYLLAEQGIYAVKGKLTIDEYTKGLFRVGGATYDYAAAGYDHYAPLMRDIRAGITRNNNGAMDNVDNQFKSGGSTSQSTTQVATKTKAVLAEANSLKGQKVGSGQCYALSAWYAMKLDGPGLGGGVTGFRGLIGFGQAASHIGTDYNWGQFGWKVVQPNKTSDLIAGSIVNIRANAGSPVFTGGWGHTVIVKSLSGDTLTVLEQNYNNVQTVQERTYSASAYLAVVQTVCYPPEIIQGKRVEGTAALNPSQNETATMSEEKDILINPSLYREWKNEKGQIEFYLKNSMLYAPLSKSLYPSAFTGIETDDNWIRKDIDVDTDSEEKLISVALADLRKHCYPAVTYEVTGFIDDLNIGDTIKINDPEYTPSLILEARVSEQHISFTNPNQNKTVFDNFRALENKISQGLIDRMSELAEAAKPYDLRLITDNGTVFANGEGRSVLTAELWKGNTKFNATYQFKRNNVLVGAGLQLAVDAADVSENKPLIITVEAYIGNELIASKQITFTNSVGEQGPAGRGIISTEDYYLASPNRTGITSATMGWSKEPQQITETNKYHWYYHVDVYSDRTRKETKPAIIGVYGDKGQRGSKGDEGPQGPPGALDETQLQGLNKKIDGKADQTLTIEQINKLAELQAIAMAELQAKASIDALASMQKQIQAAIDAMNASQKLSEQDLITAGQRAIKAQNDILDLKEQWNFIDNYMSASEEGLIIGSKDGTSSVRVAKDRIAFYSSGAEVASITGGMLKIDNGMFVATLQVGHFREEMYKVDGVDKHMNVTKYYETIVG